MKSDYEQGYDAAMSKCAGEIADLRARVEKAEAELDERKVFIHANELMHCELAEYKDRLEQVIQQRDKAEAELAGLKDGLAAQRELPAPPEAE